jgi:hypothetical protein
MELLSRYEKSMGHDQGESNLIHPITLNRPAKGMPTGEVCLRQDIEKPGN